MMCQQLLPCASQILQLLSPTPSSQCQWQNHVNCAPLADEILLPFPTGPPSFLCKIHKKEIHKISLTEFRSVNERIPPVGGTKTQLGKSAISQHRQEYMLKFSLEHSCLNLKELKKIKVRSGGITCLSSLSSRAVSFFCFLMSSRFLRASARSLTALSRSRLRLSHSVL